MRTYIVVCILLHRQQVFVFVFTLCACANTRACVSLLYTNSKKIEREFIIVTVNLSSLCGKNKRRCEKNKRKNKLGKINDYKRKHTEREREREEREKEREKERERDGRHDRIQVEILCVCLNRCLCVWG